MVLKKLLFSFFLILFLGNINAQEETTFPYEPEWGTYYGYAYSSNAVASVQDSAGNVYVLASVNLGGTNEQENANTYVTEGLQTYHGGASDVFLYKFDASGMPIWATYYGGEQSETPINIAIDQNDNLYIVGHTNSETGISTSGAYQENMVTQVPLSFPRLAAGFIAKFSTEGVLLWGTYIDGEGEDVINDIAVRNNNVVVVGQTSSSTNITSEGSFQEETTVDDPENMAGREKFIAKFNLYGERLWSTYYKGGAEYVDLDADGNVFVIGQINGQTGLSATNNAYQPQNNGGNDLFLTKFSTTGNSRLWATYYGGEANEGFTFSASNYHDFLVTASGREIYFTANTESANMATENVHQNVLYGSNSPLLVKFDGLSGSLIWATYFGGEGPSIAKLDMNEEETELWVLGFVSSNYIGGEYITNPEAYQEEMNGKDGYFAKFDLMGNLEFSSFFGGDGNDTVEAVLSQPNDSIFYVVGNTSSENNIATENGYQNYLSEGNGGNRTFIVKFAPLADDNDGGGDDNGNDDDDDLGLSQNQKIEISIYPNPNTGKFTISHTEKLSLKLYNVLGQLVYTQETIPSNNKTTVDVQRLSAGIYFAHITNEDKPIKIIKVILK